MSSTSSGLFCKIAAASENVTPSKLVLFREMRRPPEKSTNHCKILITGCHKRPNVVSRNYKLHVKLLTGVYVLQFLLLVLRTGFDSAIFVCRPIRHNGGNEDPKVKFTCIVLPHYHKA